MLHVECRREGTSYDGTPMYRVTVKDGINTSIKDGTESASYIIWAPDRKKAMKLATLLFKAGFYGGYYIYSKRLEKGLLEDIIYLRL